MPFSGGGIGNALASSFCKLPIAGAGIRRGSLDLLHPKSNGQFRTLLVPAITNANLGNGGVGGVAGFIETDGTTGPLSEQNVLSFQLGVMALIPPRVGVRRFRFPAPALASLKGQHSLPLPLGCLRFWKLD